MNNIDLKVSNVQIFLEKHISRLSNELQSAKTDKQRKYLKETLDKMKETEEVFYELHDLLHSVTQDLCSALASNQYLSNVVNKRNDYYKKYVDGRTKEEIRYDSIDKHLRLDL